MMGARGDKEIGLSRRWVTKDRRHHRHIGQVRSAGKRIVAHEAIACGHPRKDLQEMSHGVSHRTQVHGNMRRVGNQRTVAAEHGAAVVTSLLDVHADRRSPQDFTHRVGDSLQSSGDHFQQHGIGMHIHRFSCCLIDGCSSGR